MDMGGIVTVRRIVSSARITVFFVLTVENDSGRLLSCCFSRRCAPPERLSNPPATPVTAPPTRIEFIDRILPRRDLVFVPDAPVRADISALRKPTCLLHAVKRGAANGDDLQHLHLGQHAARR